MTMSRILFNHQPTAPVIDTGRADVACFIGLVRFVSGASVPPALSAWLKSLGYPVTRVDSRGNPISQLDSQGYPVIQVDSQGYPVALVNSLSHVPLMIESYPAFTSIFDDGSAGNGFGTDYLAAAVRSFFAQGGKRCYVVRVDDPLTPQDSIPNANPTLPSTKQSKLNALLFNPNYSPTDASTWTGVGALAALEEVSYFATPDLPALCASEPVGALGQAPITPTGPQEFTDCTQGPIVPVQQITFVAAAPRLAVADYATWAANVATIINYLANGPATNQLHLREMQYVAALPIPQDMNVATASENPSADEVAQDIQAMIALYLPVNGAAQPANRPNLSSPFLQLAYPWLKTSGSGTLLEQLEPPDGALIGLIARNALTRGAFTSATKIVPSEIYDVQPTLPDQEMQSSATVLTWDPSAPEKRLIERLSLFGPTPTGLQLLSDLTASPGASVRQGAVNRLVNVIYRAARKVGETSVFQNNGPAQWGRVQRALQNLMTRAWTLGALDGATATAAFSVRCDRSTMTQNDLDNGRLIAMITFTPAALIETITVTLAMETTGTSAQAIATAATQSSLMAGTLAGGTGGN